MDEIARDAFVSVRECTGLSKVGQTSVLSVGRKRLNKRGLVPLELAAHMQRTASHTVLEA